MCQEPAYTPSICEPLSFTPSRRGSLFSALFPLFLSHRKSRCGARFFGDLLPTALALGFSDLKCFARLTAAGFFFPFTYQSVLPTRMHGQIPIDYATLRMVVYKQIKRGPKMKHSETDVRRPKPSGALKISPASLENLLPHEPAGTPINGVATMITERFAWRDEDLAIGSREFESSYIVDVELPCDECGGSGFDPGGIDPWGPEPCPACQGAKTQKDHQNLSGRRRFPASPANPECRVPVERVHLVAIIQYCRQIVGAVVGLPEVRQFAGTQPGLKKSVRHGRESLIVP